MLRCVMDEEKQQVEDLARALIGQYAGEAEAIAAGHAETMLDQGDIAGFEMWKRVMAVIRGLQSGKQIAC